MVYMYSTNFFQLHT